MFLLKLIALCMAVMNMGVGGTLTICNDKGQCNLFEYRFGNNGEDNRTFYRLCDNKDGKAVCVYLDSPCDYKGEHIEHMYLDSYGNTGNTEEICTYYKKSKDLDVARLKNGNLYFNVKKPVLTCEDGLCEPTDREHQDNNRGESNHKNFPFLVHSDKILDIRIKLHNISLEKSKYFDHDERKFCQLINEEALLGRLYNSYVRALEESKKHDGYVGSSYINLKRLKQIDPNLTLEFDKSKKTVFIQSETCISLVRYARLIKKIYSFILGIIEKSPLKELPFDSGSN